MTYLDHHQLIIVISIIIILEIHLSNYDHYQLEEVMWVESGWNESNIVKRKIIISLFISHIINIMVKLQYNIIINGMS